MGLGPAPPGASFPGTDGITLDVLGAGGTAEAKAGGIDLSQLATRTKRRFSGLNGDRTSTATESAQSGLFNARFGNNIGPLASRTTLAVALVYKNLSVYIAALPLVTNGVTITLYKGTGAGAASATALTVTYDSTSAVGTTVTATADVAFAVGDYGYWQVDYVGLNGTGKTFTGEAEWWPA